jgi:secreted Zn-dependent insulinase-like peptidase
VTNRYCARYAWYILVAGLASISLVGCTGSEPDAATTTIVQSANDDRAYRHLLLENQLSVIVISDPDSDKAAASLSVYRGSYDNPIERAGLAHFLEHMLFLGTAKYPEVDGYQAYMSTHGGSHNAYTASDHTNYFFDIDPEFLEGGLDRFAQFFVAPRFDEAYVEREKNAVNSEYQLQLKDDGWRGFMVSKVAFNQQHPGSRFNIGSLDTLAGDVRADLLEFFNENYSADQMGLVVLGNQSLDQLEAWVTDLFSAIRNATPGPGVKPGPLFAPGDLPKQLSYRTIKNERSISFSFPAPSIDPFYRENPLGFVSNLLGHEGEGSLHAALKQRGWIHSLSGGGGRYDRDNAVVTIDIELTDSGAAHIDEITDSVFAYIALIRDRGVEAWRYHEQQQLSKLAFRFQDKQPAQSYVRTISPGMNLYPIGEVLIAPYLMEDFDADLIERFLGYLTRANVLIEVSGPDVDTNQVEKWFQVPYRIDAILAAVTKTPGDMILALPERNPFIPERLELMGSHEERPQPGHEQPGASIWVARDTSFGVPRASVQLRLATQGGFTTARDAAYANLYSALVRDALNSYAYPATMAGLRYSIGADATGFRIGVHGYSDKLPLLLEHVLVAFSQLELNAERVALYKSQLLQDWGNFTKERPYTQAYASLGHLLIDGRWAPVDLAEAIADVDLESLKAWRTRHHERFNVLGLITGNVMLESAGELARTLEHSLPLGDFAITEAKVTMLDTKPLTHALPSEHDDAAMVLYVQGQSESFAERALYGLSGQLLRAPYFTDLRTEQQLGYAVNAGNVLLRRRPGMSFIVQSPVAGPDQLVAKTEAFLKSFRDTLQSMPNADFEANKQGLITRLLERDQNLAQRSSRYWNDLEFGHTTFDSRNQIAEAVAKIEKTTYLTFFDELRERVENNRLVIYSPGRFDAHPEGTPFGGVGSEGPPGGEYQPNSRRNGGNESSNDAP